MGACHGKSNIIPKTPYDEFLLHIVDYNKIPIVNLEQAVIPLIPCLPTIQKYVRMVKDKCQNPADGLTSDESASIMLYSLGWEPLNECLYVVLNTTLQTINRKKIRPWFLYLKLLFTAILHLPTISLTVYRGNKLDLSTEYKKDELIFWWDLSLCRNSMDKYLDNKETKTIFTIECNTVKDIRNHSYFQSDDLLLILSGTQFRVVDCLNQNNDLQEIILQEIQSSFILQNSKKISKGPLKHHKSSVPNSIYRNLSVEQLIFESGRDWTVDLDEKDITDRDMKTIVKHAIIKNRCKRIRLRDNNITHEGVIILAEGLNNNHTLESLDLRNNYISDLGVQSLSLAIIHSKLKTLNLESNGITAEGAEYLANMIKHSQTLTELYLSKNHLGDRGIELLANALNDDKKNHQETSPTNLSTLQHLYLGQNDITDVGIEYLADMLKTNRMLTWLWLSGNEIGNRGVELLANVLANNNNSLEWLFLNSNKAISDTSIDVLIHMLKRNHSLKTIYINNCNLSEIAKQKLQDITKLKKDFDLEV